MRRKGRASGARRSGGVGPGERRSGSSETLAARKDRGRTIGDGERRKLGRRRGKRDRGTARASSDARTRVVSMRREGGVGRCVCPVAWAGGRVMRVSGGVRGAGRRGDRRPVHRARLYDARLPDNQGEPDGETGRQRAKPRCSTHHYHNGEKRQNVPERCVEPSFAGSPTVPLGPLLPTSGRMISSGLWATKPVRRLPPSRRDS